MKNDKNFLKKLQLLNYFILKYVRIRVNGSKSFINSIKHL